LEYGQVAIELPGMNLLAIVGPLYAFSLHKAFVNGIAQSFADERVIAQIVQGFSKGRRQKSGEMALAFTFRAHKETLIHGWWQGQTPLNAIKASAQHNREGQVGVATGITATQFDTS